MCGNVNTVSARQYIIKSGMLQDCYSLSTTCKLNFCQVTIFICNKYDIPSSTQQNCCMPIIGFNSNQSQS